MSSSLQRLIYPILNRLSVDIFRRRPGLGDYPIVYDTFLQHSYAFILEWMFGSGEEGGQPLPPFEDFRNVNPSDVSV